MRKDVTAENWHIVLDKEDNKVVAYPTNHRPYISATSRYEELGKFTYRDDAESFCQYKELGITPDGVAYLEIERHIRNVVKNPAGAYTDELDKLMKAVQTESDRKCFGSCKSLDGSPACRICYSSLKKTWALCACIMCLRTAAATD